MTIPLLLLLSAAAQQPLQTRSGDATITLGGDVMGRIELRDDADLTTPGGESDDPMRARGALHFAVDYGPYLGAFAELMGSWSDTGASSDEDLQQMWIEAERLIGDWRLRVGRSELDYGDGRLVASSRSWLFEPNAFDAAVVSGDSIRHDFTWSAWFANGANGPAAVAEDRFTGAFARFGRDRDAAAETYVLLRDTNAPENRQVTYALRLFGETVHGLDWSFFGAHQDGRLAGAGATWAQAMVLTLGKELDGGHRIGVELAYATGDGRDPEEHNRFDPVYMDQHRYHGRADLFAFANLVDLAVLYGLQWNERWSFHLDLHSFWRESTRDDAYAAYTLAPYGITGDDRALGHELDLYAEGELADGLGFDFGGALFLSGSAMPADEDQIWLFARFLFTF